MKNYTLNTEEKKNFIINYEILEDSINVFYADGHNKHLPKTEEQIAMLDYTLENQVRRSSKYESNLCAKIASHLKVFLGSSLFLMLITLILLNQGMITSLLTIDFLGGLLIGYETDMIRRYRAILKDISKNKKFLENRDELLKVIDNNPMVLTNTTKKTQELIQERISSEDALSRETITLNILDQISPEDMDIILANMQDIESTGHVSFESDEKPYTISPKK